MVTHPVTAARFSEWFHDVIEKAGIIDYRYPVKGCGVWLPYGFKLRQNVAALIRRLLDETDHEEVLFPTLITAEMLRKEAEHIGSFEEQTFWVTHAGRKKIEEEYALRPTSETAIAPMWKLWIRSHADLPVRIYQIVSIFRYETKATRPLIRVREITTFKEAHTAHASAEEAEDQVKTAVAVYSRFFDELCLPYLKSRRPDWDKFAGAEYSIAFDTVLPDGRVLQIGTVHNLGQNFSQAFDVSFETPDGKHDFVFTTSYGISERVIAAIIAVHGDDKGLMLPSSVAPFDVVIVSIPYKGFEEKTERKAQDVQELLTKNGLRVAFDDRDKITPGSKFFHWEVRGVPIRIEIGPRDLQQHKVTLYKRNDQKKTLIDEKNILDEVRKTLVAYEADLRTRGLDWINQHITKVENLDEAKFRLEKKQGVVEVPLCAKDECGRRIEHDFDVTILGTPEDFEGMNLGEKSCVVCSEKAVRVIRFAKSY